jgi:glycosyltransferase involved in cell wall biosynthesis
VKRLPRLLLHVVYGLDTGGLENGDLNLINRMPWEPYGHMVLALTEELKPAPRVRLRLVLVGDGPLRAEAQSMLAVAGLRHLAWLRGERVEVPDVMCGLGGFVLPSLAEGISNRILQTMACACPSAGDAGRR